ncbi:MAG: MFS transporter [Clostridiales bacterium]|nr:MFS transporter [Clostridiales bacterium]
MSKLPDEQKRGVIANLTPVQSILMMIALLSATLGMCGDALITPGADQMFKHYDNETFVDFLLSGPNLVSMFASILAGVMQRYVDKKKVLLLGMALFVVGGVFGTAIDSQGYMMFMRCLVGLALGFTNVTAMSIVTTMYINDDRRSRMIGIINAGMFCSAMLLTAISGWVCEMYGWQAMFYVYAIGIVSIILIMVFIPKIPADIHVDEEESQGPESGMKGWVFKLIVMLVGYWIFQVSYAVIPFFISVYADETGLGGPAFAGQLTAALFGGALVASLCFGFVYPKLKRYSMPLSMVLLIVAYAILLAFPSTVPVIIGCIIFGYANANAFSQALMRAGIVAPAKSASLAVGITAAVMGFGFFAATFTVTMLKSAVGVDTLVPIMPILLVINIVLAAVSFIYIAASNRKEKEELSAAS